MKQGKSWITNRNRRTQPESVSNVLGSAFKRFGIEEKIKDYSSVSDWDSVVGPNLASVSAPEKITRSGVLVVRVADATWAQEITLLKSQILETLQRRPNGPMLHDIRFVVGGPRELEQQKRANR